MARRSRAQTSETISTPTKSSKEEVKAAKTNRDERNAVRRKLYKKAKRAQQVQALQDAIRAAETPATKKELLALRGQVFRPWRPRKTDDVRVAELECIVRQQQEEIRELKKTLEAGGVPRLAPVSPRADGVPAGPDSSPVKIRQQLMNDVSQSSNTAAEEVAEAPAGEGEPAQMEGVEETVATSIEHDAGDLTLPSVEGEDVADKLAPEVEGDSIPKRDASAAAAQQDMPPVNATKITRAAEFDTPSKSKGHKDSSVDSSADTPLNVRRSPRKRTVKRRSFAGHSYAV